MATDDEFQAAQDDGLAHDFTPRTRNGTDVRGGVIGRGQSVVTTADGGATRTWKVEDARGNTHEIAAEDYDID
jgi:hypothetical protein